MKLAKDIGIATFAVAISVAAVGAKPTQAAVVNYNFTVNVTSSPNQYYGSFSYDDSTLTATGYETLGINSGLSILFGYLGNKYTEKDDLDYNYGTPPSPLVSFQDGNLLGLSYLVEDQFLIASDLDNPGDLADLAKVGGNNFYSIVSGDLTSAAKTGIVNYSKGEPVPEPLTLGGTAIAGAIGWWFKRQKKAS